jgi:hypothetical protein
MDGRIYSNYSSTIYCITSRVTIYHSYSINNAYTVATHVSTPGTLLRSMVMEVFLVRVSFPPEEGTIG